MRLTQKVLLGSLMILPAVAPVHAAMLEYSNQSSWLGVVTGTTNVNFDAVATGYSSSLTQGTNPNTVTFTPISGFLQVIGSAIGAACSGNCLNNDLGSTNRGVTATLALNSVTAFGLNLFTVNSTSQNVVVKVFLVGNGTSTPDFTSTVATNANSLAPVFFGMALNSGTIASIQFTTASDTNLVMDNVEYGTYSESGGGATPEAGTLAYMMLGVAAVALGSWRRRRAVLAS